MRVLRLLSNHSPYFLIITIILGLISGISGAMLVVLIKETVTALSESDYATYFALFCLVLTISEFFSQALLVRLYQNAIFHVREQLIDRILKSSLSRLESIGASPLYSALTDDVSAISQATLNLPVLVINTTVVISVFAYLAWLSVEAQAGAVVFLVLGTFIYESLRRVALQYFRRSRLEQETLFEHFRGLTTGIKDLKLDAELTQSYIGTDYRKSAMTYRGYNVAAFSYLFFGGSAGRIFLFLYIGFLLYFLRDDLNLSLEVVAGACLAILFLRGPIEWIFTYIPMYAKANIALSRQEHLGLEDDGEADIRRGQVPTPHLIELKNLTHSYFDVHRRRNFDLGPINLTLRSGEVHFLIGGNGSGKSTLAKILAGLYAASGGNVRVNGEVDITPELVPTYRQFVAATFQDSFLFPAPPIIGDDMQRARDLLERLRLTQKVSIENGRYSTITALSEGQKKRLLLLEALLKDRPIYIFDEWAADQDPHFRVLFYQEILPELRERGKIVIVISHDDAYYHVADQIIRLDYGRQIHSNDLDRFLGRILTRRGIISPEQLNEALNQQSESRIGERIGEILIRLGYCTPTQLHDALAGQLEIGQLLIVRGLITDQQLQYALDVRQETGREIRLGEMLVELGMLRQEEIEAALQGRT